MGKGTHQYQIVYREDKPSLVRIHPVDSGTAPGTFPNGSDATTQTDLLQQAHQLYREQKYQNVLTICNHVRGRLCCIGLQLSTCLRVVRPVCSLVGQH